MKEACFVALFQGYLKEFKKLLPLDGQLRKPGKITPDFFRYFNKNLIFSVKSIKTTLYTSNLYK